MASCGLPSAVGGARVCELGSTTRPDIDADCCIILGNPHPGSRPIRASKTHTQHARHAQHAQHTHWLPVRLKTRLAMPSMNGRHILEHGDVLWLCFASGSLPQEGRRDAPQLPPMGHPVLQGDHIQTALRSESCDTFRTSCTSSTIA